MILLDINIFMDVLGGREGFESSIKIIDSIRNGKIQGYISALTIPILWFLVSKWQDPETAKNNVKDITKGFNIIPLTEQIIQNSFESKMQDFEDAIQFYSALKAKCVAIITRNKRDFEINKGIDILTPEEFLSRSEIK